MASLLETDIEAYLDAHANKDLLRFITCGSVDDGKSTLIGRLLYESKLIFDDQLAALEADSKVSGTTGGDLDLALLVDGLAAEREQGITIDVAYRFFTTDRRKFIVADTPGHEQYTRNMVTGASTADVAVLLVDARKGLTTQTRRHATLVGLLGISTVVLAVNKMDAVDWSADVCGEISAEFGAFASQVGIDDITVIPVSALRGDNVVTSSTAMPWYQGPPLLEWLETVPVATGGAGSAQGGPMRMPVQWVSRPDADFRGFAGQLVRGTVAPGDAVRVLPGGQVSTVERVVTFDGDLPRAVAGQSVTLVLADEIDVSRGDVLAAATDPPEVADRFDADVVWMHEHALLPGRSYLLKAGSRTVGARVSEPRHRLDVDTASRVPARTLELNEIGRCEVSTDRALPFDPYQDSRDMGSFILIDRITNATVAAGMLRAALRRADNVHWQAVSVDKTARAGLHGQRPAVVWFTGLSGAGKSTIANMVEKRLHTLGRATYLLDGDNVRHGLNRDLGFTEADRVENIRRVAEVARLMVDAGLLVLVSFISPFRAERALARGLVDEGEFFEVHVDTPLDVAEARDPKGLYAKARRGEIANFTGIDSPYEPPEAPELRVDTTAVDPAEAADAVVALLVERGSVPGVV